MRFLGLVLVSLLGLSSASTLARDRPWDDPTFQTVFSRRDTCAGKAGSDFVSLRCQRAFMENDKHTGTAVNGLRCDVCKDQYKEWWNFLKQNNKQDDETIGCDIQMGRLVNNIVGEKNQWFNSYVDDSVEKKLETLGASAKSKAVKDLVCSNYQCSDIYYLEFKGFSEAAELLQTQCKISREDCFCPNTKKKSTSANSIDTIEGSQCPGVDYYVSEQCSSSFSSVFESGLFGPPKEASFCSTGDCASEVKQLLSAYIQAGTANCLDAAEYLKAYSFSDSTGQYCLSKSNMITNIMHKAFHAEALKVIKETGNTNATISISGTECNLMSCCDLVTHRVQIPYPDTLEKYAAIKVVTDSIVQSCKISVDSCSVCPSSDDVTILS